MAVPILDPADTSLHQHSGRPKRLNALTQVLDLRDDAYNDLTTVKMQPKDKASLMRAWVDLQEVVMNLQGKGKPKPITARNDPSLKRGHGRDSEPVPVPE